MTVDCLVTRKAENSVGMKAVKKADYWEYSKAVTRARQEFKRLALELSSIQEHITYKTLTMLLGWLLGDSLGWLLGDSEGCGDMH